MTAGRGRRGARSGPCCRFCWRILINLFGPFVWNGVLAVMESPLLIGLTLAAAAGLTWLVYAADRPPAES